MVGEYLTGLFSLAGKTAIVTGAAGGIGSALACGLHSAGASVVLCDISDDALQKIQQDLGERAHAMRLDMLEIASFADFAAQAAKISDSIDILVNCAGINKREGIKNVSAETFDRIMGINLRGAFFLSQAVAEYMKPRGGSIINIGSHNTGAVLGGCAVYAASKSGLLAITRGMAVEWAQHNIRANCISPGHIKTDLTTATWEHPERSRYLLERIAMSAPGVPADIVGLAVYLASDASRYTTGEEFRIDGGCMAGGQPWALDGGY